MGFPAAHKASGIQESENVQLLLMARMIPVEGSSDSLCHGQGLCGEWIPS